VKIVDWCVYECQLMDARAVIQFYQLVFANIKTVLLAVMFCFSIPKFASDATMPACGCLLQTASELSASLHITPSI
jgi:hypothetical protein